MAARSKPRWFHSKRRAVGVAAELVVRQELAALVAFGGRDHRAADIDQARARGIARAPDRAGRACRRCAACALAGQRHPCRLGARAEGIGPRPVADDAPAHRRGDRAVGRIADLVIGERDRARRPRPAPRGPRRDRRRGTRAGSGYGPQATPRVSARGALRARPEAQAGAAGEPTPRGRTRCRTGRSNGRFHRTARCSRRC